LFRLSIDTRSVKLRNASNGIFGAILLAVLTLGSTATATEMNASISARETFSVTYDVTIDRADPARARVRWELSGIDEIERVRLRYDPERFEDFAGSGTLERRRGEIVWTPNGPYAELRYVVNVEHRRAPGKGYDSHAGDGWILSRTSGFFPRSAVLFRKDVEPHPESRARLVLRLPSDWTSATVLPSEGSARYLVETPRQRFDHPRGWLAFGRLKRTDATVASTALSIVRVPGVTNRVEPVLELMQRALPMVATLFDRSLARLLIVIAPDPMWRGGLSGEESFYIHADRPLRSPDYTSPYLHELFHVAAPFRPQADAHWVTEGLAEYYSVELQRRIGILSEGHFQRALELFAEHGVWNQDFTHTSTPALHNNSAPLVMYVLDQRIRAATGNLRGLDAVVSSLARDGGPVSTARFLGTIQRVAGKSFASFFRRHVYRGEQPATSSLAR